MYLSNAPNTKAVVSSITNTNSSTQLCDSLKGEHSEIITATSEYHSVTHKPLASNDETDITRVPCGAPKCARKSPRLYKKRFSNTLINEYFLGKITPEV